MVKFPLVCGIVLVLAASCGSQREVEPKTQGSKPAPTPSPGGEVTFQEVTEITDGSCKRCHSTSQFLKSEAAWRDSEAQSRVAAKSMPPAGTNEAKNLSAADRAILTSF